MYSIYRVKRTEEQWFQEKAIILFTWSILNPNGPTLNCVGIRDTASAGEWEVFFRWMHFNGGESYTLGFVHGEGDELRVAVSDVLEYAFHAGPISALNNSPLVTSVPSFVTMPGILFDSSDVCHLIVSSPAFRLADWGGELYYLNKYGDDFTARAGEEARSAYEAGMADPELSDEGRQYWLFVKALHGHLPSFNDWSPDRFQPRKLQVEDIEAWWKVVSDQAFIQHGQADLASMWVGAMYRFQNEDKSKLIGETFDELRDFLEYGSHSLWAADVTTAFVLKDMGLS